jgi:phenylacetate-CoA ligase
VNWIYTRFVYPTFESENYNGLSGRLDALRRREGLSLRENREIQWHDVLALLKHAEQTSPFYRRRFADSGINVAQIHSPDDLKIIPPLTRQDLRLHLGEIKSEQYSEKDLLSAATGGTTDTPVAIFRSRESVAWKAAVQWRFNAWAGMHPGDKTFYLWGARQDYSDHPNWRWRVYDRNLMKRVWAPTSLFNTEVLEMYRKTLNSFRPRVIYAYPTPLALFCEHLRDCKYNFHRPVSVICTAEPLMPDQRELIEQTFGCEVFENYGSRDFAMIAGECRQHKGLHLNPAAAFVEFQPIEGAEAGDLKEILVTDLLNFGMPLIRYKINDCALQGPEQCSCGLGYPLLQKIVGRTMDNFLLRNGDVVPGISFQNRVIKTCPGLAKTQIIQESLDDFLIRYVPGPTFSLADLELLRSNLGRFLPEGLRFTFEQVVDIPRERSGKTRFCISRVTTHT